MHAGLANKKYGPKARWRPLPPGSVAIKRGPVVYCLEQADQPTGVDVLDVRIDETAPLNRAPRDVRLDSLRFLTTLGPTANPTR